MDEAQNLTPLEVKTNITRAGEGSKVVFTGDNHQIDMPYLDSQSNGLTLLIDRMKEQDLFAHVELVKGERSRLAELASRILRATAGTRTQTPAVKAPPRGDCGSQAMTA